MRILIIDDHVLFREAAALILERLEEGLTVIEASTADEALRLISHYEPLDLVLLDLTLPGLDGLQAIPECLSRSPQTPVVAISGNEEIGLIRDVIEAGAAGFIPKSASSHEFLSALRIVLAGDLYLPTRYLDHCLPPKVVEVEPEAIDEAELEEEESLLTERQQQVLSLLGEGLSNKQIARELGITESTIKLHVSELLRRLEVHNRTEAVMVGVQQGWISQEKSRVFEGEHSDGN